MSIPVNRSVNIFIESGEAQKTLDLLTAKQKNFAEQLKTATDPKVIQRLTDEFNKLSEPIDKASKKLSGQMAPSLKETSAVVAKLSAEIRNLSADDPNFPKKLLQLKQATLEYDRQRAAVSGLAKEHQSASSQFGQFAKRVAEGVGIFEVTEFAFNKIVEFGKQIVEETLAAEQANTKLKNILDNIGRSDLFEGLKAQAEKLHDTFKAIKPEDITNVFTQLATYGKLSENQIKLLTPVIIDFARKSGGSLQESASTILKALEGNGKALKEYAINIKDGANVTERFGIIMDQLKPRVQGAEQAFENTTQGGFAKFKTTISEIQKGFGQFIESLFASKPTLDTLFDQAKEKSEGYEKTLHPLLERYDELKSKTNLNKVEHKELQGVIQKIAEIIPDSVTQFNKYGVAIDINRGKVEEFSKAQKQFLAEKEFDAVKQLTADALENVKQISNAAKNLSEGGSRTVSGQFFAFGAGDKENILASLRSRQEDLLRQADTLTGKYGKTLPDAVKKAVDAIKAEFDAINSVKTPGADSPLNPNADDPNKVKKPKVENQFAQDLQKLQQQQDKISELNKTEFQKKLEEAQREYEAFQALIGEQFKKGQLDQVQRNELDKEAHENFVEQQHQLRLGEIKKQFDEQTKADKKLNDERNKIALEGFKRTAEELAKLADSQLKDAKARDELNVLNASDKSAQAKLAALKKQLDDEEYIALNAEGVTADQRLLIEKQFYNKRRELDQKYIKDTVQQYAGYINELSSAFQSFFSLQNQATQTDIDQEKTANDAKKTLYQNQLNGKLITQADYQRKVDALDKQVTDKQNALKLKEFNQNKVASLARAAINVAESITKAFTDGPIVGQILAGIVAAVGLVEIGIIAAQKPPTYAKGGALPQGPSHQEGGMPIINPRTGQKVAEIEGGEPILSRSTYRNNKGLVDALLFNSMYRNGAQIKADWMTQQSSSLNIGLISRSLDRVRMFASGGILPNQAAAAPTVAIIAPNQMDMLIQAVSKEVRARVVLQDVIDAQTRLTNIQDTATLR